MRLILKRGGETLADLQCGDEAVFAGPDEQCRLHLPDLPGAPRCAVICPDGEGWSLSQLTSDGEILLNDTSISGRATLSDGDRIRIGAYLIEVFPDYAPKASNHIAISTSKEELERFAAARLPPGTIVRDNEEPLRIPVEQLFRFGEISTQIAQCVQVEDVIELALQTVLELFGGQRAWIGIRRANHGAMEYVEGRLLSGQSADLPGFADFLQARVLDRSQVVIVPRVSREERTSILAGPLLARDRNFGMLYVDTAGTGRRYTEDLFDWYLQICCAFGARLDAIFRKFVRAREALLQGQVAVSHEIQRRLTPRKLPQWQELQFGAFREPGRENTGDLYDVVKLRNGMAVCMLAHTPESGAVPSMLMGQAHAAFRVAAMHQDPPHVFLRALNDILYDGESDHPLNCFLAIIDPPSGDMRFTMAGHTGAYIISSRGEARPLGPPADLPPLSAARNTNYPLLPEQLQPGESLALFTPGVTSARNGAGEVFGEQRFVDLLCDGFGQQASAMLKEMLTDLQGFTEGGAQPEDITVLLAHRAD